MPSAFTKLNPQPPVREEDFLLKLPLEEKVGKPEQRDPYDMIAPGRYPDETVYKLDTDDLVAISVETSWLPNGAGVSFLGYARWVEEDGQSHVTFDDKEVLSEYTLSIPPEIISQFTVNDVASDVARILLGEDPVLVQDVTNGNGDSETHLLVDLPAHIKSSASIRHQIDLVKQTEGFPTITL